MFSTRSLAPLLMAPPGMAAEPYQSHWGGSSVVEELRISQQFSATDALTRTVVCAARHPMLKPARQSPFVLVEAPPAGSVPGPSGPQLLNPLPRPPAAKCLALSGSGADSRIAGATVSLPHARPATLRLPLGR